jgi:glycosyltransferase involved in cell wall biosynthesis
MSARHPYATEPSVKFKLPTLAESTVRANQKPRRLRRLNICLLIPTLESGGAERVCSSLASHWARSGHHVTLMTFSEPSTDVFAVSPFVNRVVLSGAEVTSGWWSTGTKNVSRLLALRAQLVQSKADVGLSFMSVPNVLMAIAGLGLATACIGAERTYPAAVTLPKLAEWSRWVAYGWLDTVVGLTDESAGWLQKHTLAKAVAVIPNPVVLPLTSGLPSCDPQQLCLADSHLLLAAGRLSSEKNFENLIRAFATASRDLNSRDLTSHPAGKPWQLVIVGEGPLRPTLEALIEELGVQERVLLPGRVGNMADWYSAADAFAMTSAFEGYPNALLEALAHGVPAVACDCLTGPSELIHDGINGLLVPPDSALDLQAALSRLMGDGELRASMANRADITVQAHAIEGISDRWEAVFSRAMAAKGYA